MRQVRHPLVERDLLGLVDHIVRVTDGDFGAASRRLDEIDVLLDSISDNPTSGVRLSAHLDGWIVRHGGRDQKITIVFRPDLDRQILYIALIAYGGRDWLRDAEGRQDFSP